MQPSFDYSFPRYLAAKKSVDDRALNRHVWQSLAYRLPPSTSESPLQVLEIGAGIGTMLERMLDWGLFSLADYTALELQAENVACASQRLPEWAESHGYRLKSILEGRLMLENEIQKVGVSFEAGDLFTFCSREVGKRRWDLLVAHAFLDLMDVPAILPRLAQLVRPGGLFYFTLNFDGVTILEPSSDPAYDDFLQQLYHHTMDTRLTSGQPSGDSRTGRRLFGQLRQAGYEILDAGSSDWVVFPRESGYPGDEGYFLHFIVNTIQQALWGHPQLEPGRFSEWISGRHTQITRGELVYIAHQIDFVGLVP